MRRWLPWTVWLVLIAAPLAWGSHLRWSLRAEQSLEALIGPSGEIELLEMKATAAPALSAVDHGRIYYDAATNAFLASTDGGAYTVFGGGISTLGGLTGATQTFADVDDTNVTLTIGSAGTTHTWTAGWAGTLAVARGGTGATALTAGSIVFAGAAGVYSQDNANLFWDDTNNRLGVLTATPTRTLTAAGIIKSTTGGFEFPDGTVQITASAGGAGAAPETALYVVLATHATLTAERVLTAGGGISLVDAGPNAAITVANTGVTSVTGTAPIVSSGGATPALSITDASTAAKGAAQFSSAHFDVAAGVVSLGTGVVSPTELAATAVVAGTYTLSTVTVDADGRITSAASGTATGAPTDAPYLTQAAHATLTAERSLAAGLGISLADGGANSTLTVTNTGILSVSIAAPLTSTGGQSPTLACATCLTTATGAPIGSAFVTVGASVPLTAERSLAVTSPLTLTDGGANAAVTLACPTCATGANFLPLAGGTMTGNILANATGLDLGSTSARWDLFANKIEAHTGTRIQAGAVPNQAGVLGEWSKGTTGTPDTTGGPLLRISRVFNLSSANDTAGLTVAIRNVSGGGTGGVFAIVASGQSYVGGTAYAAGIVAEGVSNASGQIGDGGDFYGVANVAGAVGNGLEAHISNNTGSVCNDFCNGVFISSEGASRNASGVKIQAGTSAFLAGIRIVAGSWDLTSGGPIVIEDFAGGANRVLCVNNNGTVFRGVSDTSCV